MRPPLTPLHLIPLISIYWLTHNLSPILTHRFFTTFPDPHLYLDLTITQILITTFLTHLYLHITPTTPTSPSTPPKFAPNRGLALALPILHYAILLLTNVSLRRLGAVDTLVWRLLHPVSAVLLRAIIQQQPPAPLSVMGVLLTCVGVYHFSGSDFTPFTHFPILISTVLLSLRDLTLHASTPRDDSEDDDKPGADAISFMRNFHWLILRTLPIALPPFIWRLFRYGFHAPTMRVMLGTACVQACYHVISIVLIPRIDAFTHAVLAVLKRLAGVLLAVRVLGVVVTQARMEGLGVVFAGVVVYLIGGSRQNLGAGSVVVSVLSAVVVVGAFVVGGGLRVGEVTRMGADVTNADAVSVKN